jgi:hypothetical protein
MFLTSLGKMNNRIVAVSYYNYTEKINAVYQEQFRKFIWQQQSG